MAESLELVLDEEGRYVDANQALLDVLGYTLDELRALRVGAITTADPTAAAAVWHAYVHDGIDVPGQRRSELRRRDGTTVPNWFHGLEPGPRPRTWTARMEILVEFPSVGSTGVLHYVLSEWRAAERRLATLGRDDPEYPIEWARVEALRDLFQRESKAGSAPGTPTRKATG